MKDINRLNYNPTKKVNELITKTKSIKYTKKDFNCSINNGYHKGGRTFNNNHTMTLEFKLKVNNKYVSTDIFNQWINDNDSWNTKWFTLSGKKTTNLKPVIMYR